MSKRSTYLKQCLHETSVCQINDGVAERCGLDTDAVDACIAVVTRLDAPVQKIYKDDARSRVVLVEHGGQRWVIKQFRASPWKTWAYHHLHGSPAWREWRGAQWLARSGCLVNAPLAMVYEQRLSAWCESLVLPYVEGTSMYHWLVSHTGAASGDEECRGARRWIAREVGRMIGTMTVAGIINRDLKPSNLIITSVCERGVEMPVVIDPAGLRRRWGRGGVYRMLADFLNTTHEPGGVTPREALVCLKAMIQADPSLAHGHRRPVRATAINVMRSGGRISTGRE